MHASSPIARALRLVLLFSASLLAQTPATLDATRARQGDLFTVTLDGAAGASGVLAVDLAPGPTPSPIGVLGLGLSPALQVAMVGLDPMGELALSAIVPFGASLVGQELHLQAALLDPLAPSGVVLSNPVSVTVQPPRVFALESRSGLFTPGSDARVSCVGLGLPGTLWTRTFVGNPASAPLRHSRLHDLTFARLDAGTGPLVFGRLVALNGNDGTTAFELLGDFDALALRRDESELLVTAGSQLLRLALPSGTVNAPLRMPPGVGAGVAIHELPGGPPRALVVTERAILPLDFVTGSFGTALVSLSAPDTFSDVAATGDRLGALTLETTAPTPTWRLHVIDGAANAPLANSPLSLPAFASGSAFLDAVPASSGATTWAVLAGGGSRLSEVEEGPLRVTQQFNALDPFVTGLDLTIRGGQWLVYGAGVIIQVDRTSFTGGVITSLPGFVSSRQAAIPESDTLDLAVPVMQIDGMTHGLFVLPTDPVGTALPLSTLPRFGVLVSAVPDR